MTIQISIYVLGMLIVLALLFDFMNGFHDAANAIATSLSTGALTVLVDRLVRILRTQPEVAHTANSLARQLHVSVRSLHRQLLAEGESLQALKDRMRRERAQHLLRGTLPVADVAAAVGFANAKAFSRAFSQWTGLSPQAFRQQAAALQAGPAA